MGLGADTVHRATARDHRGKKWLANIGRLSTHRHHWISYSPVGPPSPRHGSPGDAAKESPEGGWGADTAERHMGELEARVAALRISVGQRLRRAETEVRRLWWSWSRGATPIIYKNTKGPEGLSLTNAVGWISHSLQDLFFFCAIFVCVSNKCFYVCCL